MTNRIGFGLAACLLATLIFAQPLHREQAAKTCTLNLGDRVPGVPNGNGGFVYETVLVTLYRKGEAVRSTELSSDNFNHSVATWIGLDPGQYEVHFEAQKHGMIVKKMVLSSDAESTVRIDAFGDKDEMYGAGPTLFELERRIEALEKAKK